MHLGHYALAVLLAITPVTQAAECKLYGKGGPKWSMQVYAKDNCDSIIRRLNYTISGAHVNSCYHFNKKVGSIHGITEGKYSIKWFKGKKCKNTPIKTIAGGKYVELPKVSGDIYFRVLYDGDLSPYSRHVYCGQKKLGSRYPPLAKQKSYSKAVCNKVQEKADQASKKKNLPPGQYYRVMNAGVDEVETQPGRKIRGSCHITTPEVQKWYDKKCRKTAGYSCYRTADLFHAEVPGRVKWPNVFKIVPCGSSEGYSATDYSPATLGK